MNYREIIKLNIREAIKKRDKCSRPRDKEYWNKVIVQLIADLRDYETQTLLWRRIPRHVHIIDIDEIIRRFLNEL